MMCAMSIAVQYAHIVKPASGPARLERVPRVLVSMIARDYLFFGWSIEEMCRQHPYLQPGEAHSAMAYYFDHMTEIEGEIAAESESIQTTEFKPSPFFLRQRALGKL